MNEHALQWTPLSQKGKACWPQPTSTSGFIEERGAGMDL